MEEVKESYRKYTIYQFTCAQCGIEFNRQGNHIRKNLITGKRYCSRQCKRESQKKPRIKIYCYCGKEIINKGGWKLTLERKRYVDQASLDRIIPEKGYTKGNVQFVSLIAQYAKHIWPTEDVIKFSYAVVSRYPLRNQEGNFYVHNS